MEKHSLLQKIVNGLKDMCYIWAKEMRSTVTDWAVAAAITTAFCGRFHRPTSSASASVSR